MNSLTRRAILLLCLLTSTASAQSPPDELQTEHYSIHAEKLDLPETGRLLEAFHAQMTIAFGKSPTEKLRVEIYATQKLFQAALKADGQPPVDAGGYYSPGTCKAYLWLQPSEYFTRQLTLHEAAHQFHFLTSTRNQSPKANWYKEGLAEYYAMHVWDGHTLKLGVVPAISLEDYPATAIDHFTQKLNRDLAPLVSGQTKSERPEAWALVHYLANNDADRFAQLRQKLDLAVEPDAAWNQVFGPVNSEFVDRYEQWIARNAQPWKIVWTGWQQVGDELEGKSDTSALAILKETPKSLRAAVTPIGSAMPALIFGFKSDKEFFTWQLMPGRKLRVDRFDSGKWTALKNFTLAKAAGPVTLEVRSTADGVSLRAEGKEWATMASKGSVGLYVQEGTARFRVSADGK